MAGTLFQDNLSPYLTVVEQGSTPATPSAGDQKLFIRTSDHVLCYVNSSGTVTPVASAAGLNHTILGYNTVGGSSEVMTGNRWYCKQVTPANTGLLTNIEAYITWGADDLGAFAIALFDDNAGAVGKALHSAVIGGTATGQAYLDLSEAAGTRNPRWFGAACNVWVTASTAYWIAVAATSGTTNPSIKYDGSGSDHYFTPGGWRLLDGPYSANTTSANKYSIRADLVY